MFALKVAFLAVIPVPRDGNCLFHALALYEHVSAGALRVEVADYLEREASTRTSVAETLVWLEEAARLRAPAEQCQGGHTAAVGYSALRRTSVVLHKFSAPNYPMELLQIGVGPTERAVHVLMHNASRCYDGLVVVDDLRGFVPAWPQPYPSIYFFAMPNMEEDCHREGPSPTPKTEVVKQLHRV